MAKRKSTESATKPALTIDEEKVKEARKKVNDLLKGTGLEEPDDQTSVDTMEVNEMVSPVADEEKASRWLEHQLNALNQQVEELENRVIQLTNENNALKSNNPAVSHFSNSESEKQKVIELYRHFEGVYNGRNKYNRPFKQIAFSNPQYRNGVLDMFLQTFPYLHDYVQYKHWG